LPFTVMDTFAMNSSLINTVCPVTGRKTTDPGSNN